MSNLPSLNEALHFSSGQTMKNRFMLAPMTNCQSHPDGTLSDDEFKWLTMRAQGGFGLTMTCASHVQAVGQGFPGQLGVFGEEHVNGHRRLADAIRSHGSLAIIQLHHAGIRTAAALIGDAPVGPSPYAKTGARALTTDEVKTLRDAFIQAAQRAQTAGYDGAEIHGAHGYVVTQFLSEQYNQRLDEYGGSFENRQRLLMEILEGVRQTCGTDFCLGVRLSPERYGLDLPEMLELGQRICQDSLVDFLDWSLWDVFKYPEGDDEHQESLLTRVLSVDRGACRVTGAGKILTAADARKVLAAGVDFITVGQGAILHHDYPQQVMNNEAFVPRARPVSPEYLQAQGLSPVFIKYMRRWPNFVGEPSDAVS